MAKMFICQNCGDDEQLSPRTIEQGLEDDLWIRTAQLNTTYIPTWNIKIGDFGEISPFLFLM